MPRGSPVQGWVEVLGCVAQMLEVVKPLLSVF